MPRNSRVSLLLGVLLCSTLFSSDGTATVSSDPLRGADDFGLLFDGLDDRLQLGTLDLDAGAGGSAGLTLEVRFRAEDLCRLRGCDGRLISKATGVAEQEHYWMLSTLQVGADVRLRFRLKTNGTTTTLIPASGDLTPGRWYHAAATYDGGRMRLYLDGVEVANAVKSGPVSADPTVAVWLGDNPPVAGSRPFAGLIDDVRLWSRALSALEIQESKDRKRPGNERGLTAYFPLDEGMGQTAFDRTPKQHHGSLGSTLGSDANDPAWFLVDDLPDTIPPTVRLTKPVDREVVSGTITGEAEASDDERVDHVEFLLDGVALGPRQDRPPYVVRWDARMATDGAHSLSAVATDSSGNSASHTLTVTVANGIGRGTGYPVGSPRSATVAAVTPTRYVRSGATGTGDGSDWVNASPQLPATLARGTTYYVASGSYPGYAFNDPVSGQEVIRIVKATQADHGTGVGWSPSYDAGPATWGPVSFDSPYWVFDGRRGSGTGSTDPYGFRIAYSGTAAGVKLVRFNNAPSYITVSHVDMQHAGAFGDHGHDIVYSLAGHHYTFSYCYLHDVGRVPILLRGTNDSVFEHCYIARNESTPTEHSEAVSAFNGTNRNVIRHSVFEDIEGTGAIMFSGDGWEIYGNVIFWTPAFNRSTYGNGAIGTWSQPEFQSTNTKIYNNVFANLGNALNGGLGLKAGNNAAYNNLWYKTSRPRLNGVSHDHNSAFDCSETSPVSAEAHGEVGTGDPFVSLAGRNFHLTHPTAPGVSLPPPYDKDPSGAPRGLDGVWDRGAFEFGSPGPSLPVVSVTTSDATASEPGVDTGNFALTRTGSTSVPLTVNVSWGGSAINGVDYSLRQGTLTFPAGAVSVRVSVVPTDDALVEGTESVVLTVGAGAAYQVGSPSSATVTLADNDAPSTPSRYVRAGATGSNSGLDWANAYPELPAMLVRGDVYYIADGNYPGYVFDDPVSGSQYVTIKKATLSDHGTESGWLASYGDGSAEFPFWDIQASYVSIDGQVGQWAPDLPGFVPYGIRVRLLATGTGAKVIRVGRSGFPKDFIRLRHVEAQFTNTPRQSGSWYQGLDILYGYGDHWTIEYSWLHDAGRVCFLPVGGDHHLVDHSVLERNGHAQVAQGYNPSEHSEIMAAQPDADFGTIRHSYVRDWRSTGGLMLFANCDNWSFYGNVFATTGYWTPGVDLGNANGVMDVLQSGQSSIVVYNNTFADIAYGGFVFISIDPSKVQVRNNIFDGVTNFPGLPVTIGGVRSHNWYRNVTGTFSEPAIEHGTSDPFVNRAGRNYRLRAPTRSGDITIGATYAVDPDNVRRGDDGVWDRGAFEFSGTADTTPPVISGVATSPITSSGATIAWTTNEGSDSQVEYGTSTAYGSSTTLNTSLVTSHSQAVGGLVGSTLYHYRVKSKDAAGNLASSADFTFTTTPAAAGTLTGSRAAWTTTTNLTTAGALDWAHWGHGGSLTMNHKRGVAQQISNYAPLGTVAPVATNYFHGSPSVQAVSWSDGTPTTSVAGTSWLAWIDTRNLSGDGFQLTVPADTTTRTLKVYAGNWCQRTKMQAILSDGSAPAFTDTSWDVPTSAWETAIYTLTYAAASSGQTLAVKLTIDLNHCRTGDVGEIGLYGAALANAPMTQFPTVSATKPANRATAGQHP